MCNIDKKENFCETGFPWRLYHFGNSRGSIYKVCRCIEVMLLYLLFTYSRRTKGREVGCVDQTFHGPFQGEGQKIN